MFQYFYMRGIITATQEVHTLTHCSLVCCKNWKCVASCHSDMGVVFFKVIYHFFSVLEIVDTRDN